MYQCVLNDNDDANRQGATKAVIKVTRRTLCATVGSNAGGKSFLRLPGSLLK